MQVNEENYDDDCAAATDVDYDACGHLARWHPKRYVVVDSLGYFGGGGGGGHYTAFRGEGSRAFRKTHTFPPNPTQQTEQCTLLVHSY